MVSSVGRCFSSCNRAVNNKVCDFEYKSGDILEIGFNSSTLSLFFKKVGEVGSRTSLKVEPHDGYRFVLYLRSKDDAVQLQGY